MSCPFWTKKSSSKRLKCGANGWYALCYCINTKALPKWWLIYAWVLGYAHNMPKCTAKICNRHGTVWHSSTGRMVPFFLSSHFFSHSDLEGGQGNEVSDADNDKVAYKWMGHIYKMWPIHYSDFLFIPESIEFTPTYLLFTVFVQQIHRSVLNGGWISEWLGGVEEWVEARQRGRDLGHKHTLAAICTLLLSQRPFKDQSRPRELVIELSKS